MSNYDYPGHIDPKTGSLKNPYRYVKVDGKWVVEMGFGENTEHFIFDIADLSTVLNLEQSLLSESSKLLADETKVPVYQLSDALVPTWYSNNGVIRTSTEEKEVRLVSKLVGVDGGVRPKIHGTHRFDFRRQSLKSFDNVEILQWPHPVNPEIIAQTGDPSHAVVVQEFPGQRDPKVNPYALVELNGVRFYRMIAREGQAFYFDLKDLDDVLSMNTIWYRASVSTRSLEGYIACSFNGSCLPLHSYLMRERPEKMTVDHCNWNKWDNRRCNMAFVSQQEQNRNRENSHYNTPMSTRIVRELRSVLDSDFQNAQQRVAYQKYAALWDASQAEPNFPRNMFASSETMPNGVVRQWISIQQHPAMLLPAWRGPKEGGKTTNTRWSGSKSAKVSWKGKMLVALEVYDSLGTVGQIPNRLWTGRVRNGNAGTPSNYPRAKYFTWSTASESWSIGKCHPFLKLTTNKIFWIHQGHLTGWKPKLFTLIAEFEKEHAKHKQRFEFPRFQPVDLRSQYITWKKKSGEQRRDQSPIRT